MNEDWALSLERTDWIDEEEREIYLKNFQKTILIEVLRHVGTEIVEGVKSRFQLRLDLLNCLQVIAESLRTLDMIVQTRLE